MTANEIRKLNERFGEQMSSISSTDGMSTVLQAATVEVLVEIAAQIAELNENIKLILPSSDEIRHRKEGSAEPTNEDIQRHKAEHKARLAEPVSDPDKFVRCVDCCKEIPRPSWAAIGENIMCDDCIPF